MYADIEWLLGHAWHGFRYLSSLASNKWNQSKSFFFLFLFYTSSKLAKKKVAKKCISYFSEILLANKKPQINKDRTA